VEIKSTTAAGKLPALRPGEFRFTTKALEPYTDPTSGQRRFRTVASSTIKDRGNDEMRITALEDMKNAFAHGITMYLNHKYSLPEDLFGMSDTADIQDSGVKDRVGNPIYDLHVSGWVDESNPRAVQLADSMERGVRVGTSVGAAVTNHKKKGDGGMDIEHVELIEGSIVGIPMNQRSWVQKAAKAAQTLDEREDDAEDDDEGPEAPEGVVEAEKASDEATEDVAAIADDPEPDTTKGDLNAEARGNLDADQFACPEKRKYPINDKAHVRAALSRIADPSNDQCGRDKILAAARRMGIGEHGEKSWTDDELLTWAMASACPDCGNTREDGGSCSNAFHHASSDSDNDGDNPAAGDDPDHDGKAIDPAAITTKATTDGQEADPAATPETASDPAIETDPVTQKVYESEDVETLVTNIAPILRAFGEQSEQIAALNAELSEMRAERDRLASENEVAKQVIERVMAQPLRRKAVDHVAALDRRLPDFLDPEVKNYLTRHTAGDES
jgi:phage head maturation protease